jgi:hypothetical protein
MKGASSKRCGILEGVSIHSIGYPKVVFSAGRNCGFRIIVLFRLFGVKCGHGIDIWKQGPDRLVFVKIWHIPFSMFNSAKQQSFLSGQECGLLGKK